VELLAARQRLYNRTATVLERGLRPEGAHVHQVTVPQRTRLVGALQANRARVVQSIAHGARAIAAEFLSRPVELHWEPIVYPANGASADAALRSPAEVQATTATLHPPSQRRLSGGGG
jgi:hypothetical protein